MKKKLICITGGYGRLGKELAKAFIKNGDEVLLTGRDESKLRSTAMELNSDAFVQDVTSESDTRNLEKYINDTYQKLDILINNAAIMRSQPVMDMNPQCFLEVIKTNLFGPFLSTHFMLSVLKKSDNGLIINISSTSGHRADAGASAYNASKFGLMGFTEALRKELRLMNIRVSTISPSFIVYDETSQSGKEPRLTGKDIAKTAVFLANSPVRTLFRDLEMWTTNPP